MNGLKKAVAGVDVHRDEFVITTLIGSDDHSPIANIFRCKLFRDDSQQAGVIRKKAGVTEIVLKSSRFD